MTGAFDPLPPLAKLLQKIDNRWRIDSNASLLQAPSTFIPPADEPANASEVFKDRLDENRKHLRKLQRGLYAGKQYSVLLIFQALDAAGKDGAIREIFEGLDVAGIGVTSFKHPTPRELAHDFLWRTSKVLLERGCIGAFNRSYYEEVLAVHVHPEFLDPQYAGARPDTAWLWPARYRAIREHERHLATANTVVLKFWLNVSPERQAQRFLERLQEPGKRWKFSSRDIAESGLRERYDAALVKMLNETSRPWAPWFCIPADDRWYLRWQMSDILLQALSLLPLHFPAAEVESTDEREELTAVLRNRIKVKRTGDGPDKGRRKSTG